MLISFMTENIKNQCQHGYRLPRYAYEFVNVPMIIRDELSKLMRSHVYKIYPDDTIPNSSLMKTKIINLVELAITCAK